MCLCSMQLLSLFSIAYLNTKFVRKGFIIGNYDTTVCICAYYVVCGSFALELLLHAL